MPLDISYKNMYPPKLNISVFYMIFLKNKFQMQFCTTKNRRA